MKIIDLLNKIAKGEKIRFKDKYRSYDECDISTFLENYITANWDWVEDDTDWLNEEVEVEDKEYEDIGELDVALLGQCDNWLRCPTNEVTKQDIELNPYIIDNVRENTLEFQRKINALIRNQKYILERLEK